METTLFIFRYNKKPVYVSCVYEKTRDGFRHIASLCNSTAFAVCHYLNRTWESYDFQSVIITLFDDLASKAEKDAKACKGEDARFKADYLKASRKWKALSKKAKGGAYKSPFPF